MILARGTPGFSGADLQNMGNQAAIQASKEGGKEVTLKHFEWAKDCMMMGAERRTHYIDPNVKKLTAYHEVSTHSRVQYGFVFKSLMDA